VVSILPALAQLPQRDLTLELRQVEEGDGAGYSVRTEPQKALMAPQQIQVRNGEKAILRLSQSIPMQWVQSVSAQSASLTASAASASSSSGGVKNAISWMDSGQSIALRPRWPGGKQPVTVEVEVQTASVGERTSAELPAQSRSLMATIVSAALGQWVTIAATGASAQSGVYGSEGSNDARRLLQLRVQAP
jgi:hypothetical protein